MADANEKEPRSIRLLGLSECQRERGREGGGGRGEERDRKSAVMKKAKKKSDYDRTT